MTAFYEGKYDILLSTTIVESGLDIPTANTLIVHRADMFGLAQLYQLRGRVGRSKTRAYALFTVPAEQDLTGRPSALKVLQVARHARRRLPARLARPRHPRRRQPARRGAVRPHQGGRLRALPADAGGGGRAAEGRRRGAGGGPVVAADRGRHAGDDPGGLRRRPAAAARPLPAARRSRPTRRSTPSGPSWSTASARCRRRSSSSSRSWRSRCCAAAPMSRRSRAGRRASSCRSATTPSPIRPACRLRRRAGLLREGAPGHEDRLHPRRRGSGRAPQGDDDDPAQPRARRLSRNCWRSRSGLSSASAGRRPPGAGSRARTSSVASSEASWRWRSHLREFRRAQNRELCLAIIDDERPFASVHTRSCGWT